MNCFVGEMNVQVLTRFGVRNRESASGGCLARRPTPAIKESRPVPLPTPGIECKAKGQRQRVADTCSFARGTRGHLDASLVKYKGFDSAIVRANLGEFV